MSPQTSHHWKKGTPVVSLKALNSSVATTLPKSNDAISRSLSHFTRIILGYDQLTKSYPPSPTSHQLSQLPKLDRETIMVDQHGFVFEGLDELQGDDRIKAIFQLDLRRHGIDAITFNWGSPDNHPWNQMMAAFIVKHWQYAKKTGAIKSKGINPSHNTKEICIGLVLRWVRGRSEEIHQGRKSPAKCLRKERQRKKRTLFQYRSQALSRLLESEQQASELMPNPDCCSDTEWDPAETHYQSIGLEWRSQQYASIFRLVDKVSFKYQCSLKGRSLASSRFDQCRLEAVKTDPNLPVCCELPQNCYDPIFLSNLTNEAKASLKMKPPSPLLNNLPGRISLAVSDC